MELKNTTLTSERTFEITKLATGTECEHATIELISTICDMSDDINMLKNKLKKIEDIVNEYSNNYILGEQIRDYLK